MDTITKQDQYFDAMSGGSSEIPEPITRKEQYYAKMAGEDVDVPEPITREEFWLHKIIEHGGGGGTTTIEPLTVTENGSYSEAGKAYSPVNVSVPNPSTGSISITENGTYDVTEKASAVVNVSGSGGGLEYEMGEWTPTVDTASDGYVYFANSHSSSPVFVMISLVDADGYADENNTMQEWMIFNFNRALGTLYKADQYTNASHAVNVRAYRLTSTSSANIAQFYTNTVYDIYVDAEKFNPQAQQTARYKANKTYKWIAIWAPTS